MSASSDPTSPPKLEMHLRSETAQLAPARKAIETFCHHHGLGEHETGDVGLCVNEALANVIRHAYGGVAGKPIVLTAELEADGRYSPVGIRVTIRDWGSGVNPTLLPPKVRDPLVPGGIGLVCLQRMMDEISFVPQPDGMLLTMVRRNRPDV